MKKFILLVVLTFIPMLCFAVNLQSLSKITILIIGEDNLPIDNAHVSISYETKEPGRVSTSEGISDDNGRFSATNSAFLGQIYFGVTKEGYYKSHGEHRFRDSDFGRWKPWNPELKVVLRKIENQVPMYAREVVKEIPVVGENIGFDLVKFDWVVPYGHGNNPDFIFNLEKKVIDRNNYDAKITILFKNKFDGIQLIKEEHKYGSDFKLPRFAPQFSYFDKFAIFKKRNTQDGVTTNFADDDNFIFRVRSEQKDGKLIKAMYGKILGPIAIGDISRKDTATIQFKYYLNPDYTRNLEFDPKRNLFGPLPPLEQVDPVNANEPAICYSHNGGVDPEIESGHVSRLVRGAAAGGEFFGATDEAFRPFLYTVEMAAKNAGYQPEESPEGDRKP